MQSNQMVETTSCPANASSLPSSGVDHVPTSWVGNLEPHSQVLQVLSTQFIALWKQNRFEKVLCFWSKRMVIWFRQGVELCCSARVHKHLCRDHPFIVTSHSATQNPNILYFTQYSIFVRRFNYCPPLLTSTTQYHFVFLCSCPE